jgi:hypothetical protein
MQAFAISSRSHDVLPVRRNGRPQRDQNRYSELAIIPAIDAFAIGLVGTSTLFNKSVQPPAKAMREAQSYDEQSMPQSCIPMPYIEDNVFSACKGRRAGLLPQ